MLLKHTGGIIRTIFHTNGRELYTVGDKNINVWTHDLDGVNMINTVKLTLKNKEYIQDVCRDDNTYLVVISCAAKTMVKRYDQKWQEINLGFDTPEDEYVDKIISTGGRKYICCQDKDSCDLDALIIIDPICGQYILPIADELRIKEIYIRDDHIVLMNKDNKQQTHAYRFWL